MRLKRWIPSNLLVLSVVLSGCEQRSQQTSSSSATRPAVQYDTAEYWAQSLSDLLQRGQFDEEEAVRVGGLVEDLRKASHEIGPRLVTARLVSDTKGHQYIDMLFYDPERLVIGVRVHEAKADGSVAFTEDYLLYPTGFRDGGAVKSFLLPVEISQANRGKDAEGSHRFDVDHERPRERVPPVVMGLPRAGYEVQVSLLSRGGTICSPLSVKVQLQ